MIQLNRATFMSLFLLPFLKMVFRGWCWRKSIGGFYSASLNKTRIRKADDECVDYI